MSIELCPAEIPERDNPRHRHRCWREAGHNGPHGCICWHRWPNEAEAASATEPLELDDDDDLDPDDCLACNESETGCAELGGCCTRCDHR